MLRKAQKYIPIFMVLCGSSFGLILENCIGWEEKELPLPSFLIGKIPNCDEVSIKPNHLLHK